MVEGAAPHPVQPHLARKRKVTPRAGRNPGPFCLPGAGLTFASPILFDLHAVTFFGWGCGI